MCKQLKKECKLQNNMIDNLKEINAVSEKENKLKDYLVEWENSDKENKDEIVNYIHCEYINEDDLIIEAIDLLSPLEKVLTDNETLRKQLSSFDKMDFEALIYEWLSNNTGDHDAFFSSEWQEWGSGYMTEKIIDDLKDSLRWSLARTIINEIKELLKETKRKLYIMERKELLKEIEKNLESKKISRLDLLKLAGINYCLECQGNNEVEENGYCENCNNNQVEIK